MMGRRVISRRALLGTGAGVVALAGAAIYGDRSHRLDDVARKIGLDPKRLPAESDEKLIRKVQNDQSILLMWTQAVAAKQSGLTKVLEPLIANAEAQLADLGGAAANIDIDDPPEAARAALDSVVTMHDQEAEKRAEDSLQAVSGHFAQVLASISVSLSQSLVVLRNARKDVS
ncbi:MAG: hypothetical protein M3Q98_16805 [Actinomycetota bacterium]|nr:hypothetical protein [Actinomycetota bacterium]